jgi:hypothetical protein
MEAHEGLNVRPQFKLLLELVINRKAWSEITNPRDYVDKKCFSLQKCAAFFWHQVKAVLMSFQLVFKESKKNKESDRMIR